MVLRATCAQSYPLKLSDLARRRDRLVPTSRVGPWRWLAPASSDTASVPNGGPKNGWRLTAAILTLEHKCCIL